MSLSSLFFSSARSAWKSNMNQDELQSLEFTFEFRITRMAYVMWPIFYPCRFSIYFRVLNLTSICFWQWIRRLRCECDCYEHFASPFTMPGEWQANALKRYADAMQQHLLRFLHMFPVFDFFDVCCRCYWWIDFAFGFSQNGISNSSQTTCRPLFNLCTGLFIYLLILLESSSHSVAHSNQAVKGGQITHSRITLNTTKKKNNKKNGEQMGKMHRQTELSFELERQRKKKTKKRTI